MTTLYGKESLDVLTSNAHDFEDLDEGQQQKYNHVDCHAGEDTKNRLYVKNVDGAYMWHCHNCGDSGFYRPKETVSRIREHTHTAIWHAEYSTELYTKAGIHRDYNDFRDEGKLWLAQYGFDRDMCNYYSIYEGVDGITLPLYNDTVEAIASSKYIHGWQVRRYNKKPKYMSFIKDKFSYRQSIKKSKLVIVEDLLSSYKLHAAGYSTMCLLGTSMSSEALRIIASLHRKEGVVLWLDDDQAGQDATIRIYKDVGPVVQCTAILMEQPKEIDMDTLRGVDL